MKFLSLTTIAVVAVAAYIINTVWVMYGIWNPESCDKKDVNTCLLPYKPKNIQWDMKVYCTAYKSISSYYKDDLILHLKDLDFQKEIKEKITFVLPPVIKNNKTMYLHAILHVSDRSISGETAVKRTTSITQYRKPLTYFKLMNDGGDDDGAKNLSEIRPVIHWRSKVNIHVMDPSFKFKRNSIPGEIFHLIKEMKGAKYLPLLYIDELGFRVSDLQEITESTENTTLEISYSPISLGKLRLWNILIQSMKMMSGLGFTEDDTEQVKGIFTDTNIWFLTLTFFVSTFHLLFEFLAFKHDVSYWKERKSMEGLSFNTVMYRCISTFVIFLYLMEEQTSLIVLVPAGIGSIIEIWKVTKALKITVKRTGWKVSVQFGNSSDSERKTEEYDQKAIKNLSYVLYPLSVIGAIYSLFYYPHKSWYSWVIKSLVNGVYAFGFLFMLPQLFINYKLKSVAHLPWKAFTYKAFNTFIDDIFAFIIIMPTSHRIACFRDDVVFFCYLYQRWLYPVDKTRANEYGIVYEDEEKKKN